MATVLLTLAGVAIVAAAALMVRVFRVAPRNAHGWPDVSGRSDWTLALFLLLTGAVLNIVAWAIFG